jgi:hypothetical protein
MKQGSMGSNPQPPAHEVGVKDTVPSYFVNNITMVPVARSGTGTQKITKLK